MSELNLFFSVLKNAEAVKLLDRDIKINILDKYNILATAYYCGHSANEDDKAKAAVAQMDINNNIHVFEYITNPIFIETYFREKGAFNDVVGKSLELKQMLENREKFDKVVNKFITPRLDINLAELGNVLQSYNMPDAEVIESESVDSGDTVDIDLPDDMFDGIDDIFQDETEVTPEQVETPETGGWTFEDDDLDGEETGDTYEDEGETLTDADLDDEEKEDSEGNKEVSEKESLKEKFKYIYDPADDPSAPLSVAVDGILKSFYDLYESCYSGIYFPDGVLTSSGILSYDKSDKESRRFVYNHTEDRNSADYLKNKSKYDRPYKAIMYAVGVTKGGAQRANPNDDAQTRKIVLENAIKIGEQIIGSEIDGRKDTTPKYVDAVIKPNMYPRFHSEIMTGYFGINPKMKDWAEKNNAKRTAYKITRFEDIMKWARKRIVDCLVEACLDSGVKIEEVGNNDAEIISVAQTMSKSLKNIMVITNMKKSYYTLKICSHELLNANLIAKEASNYYNMSSNGSITAQLNVKNDGTGSNVIEYDVILNEEEYNKASSFSAEVIDNIIQSGNVPSWSNAILGEKENGGTLTFNFKKSCSIAIYGASGSGKGIMTSALLTNALAEGCEIFYFDGKPDNGAALGKIAWDSGAGDAAVFNGCTGGSDTFQDYLENYSHGIRNVALRNISLDPIPMLEGNEKWPFNDPKARQQLSEISLTLQAFQFVHDMVLFRTNNENVEMLPNGDKRWAVFVIDEIQDAAATEKIVRNLMQDYIDVVGEQEVNIMETKETRNGTVQQQKRNGKIKDYKNWSKDTGFLFCKKWLDWADSRCLQWENVVTKSLRNSSSTLITIFQSNQWLNQTSNGSGRTTIGKLMLKVSQKTTKIVGKGALVAKNQWGDETSYSWDSKIASGKWALANGESGLRDDAKVFKPFKVFTTDLGANTMVPIDDYGAGATNCWSAGSKAGDMPRGLQSYVKYMFGGLSAEIEEQVAQGMRLPETVTPEGVLVSSYKYFDRLISTQKGQNLLDYLYRIDAIINFDGTISENEAARIDTNLNRDDEDEYDGVDVTGNNLGAYNDLFDNKEDDEELDLNAPTKPISNQPQTPIQGTQPIQPQTQPLQNTKLPSVVSYRQMSEMDTQSQNRVVNRVVSETLRNNFNVSNTTNGATFGLQHLCYNLSILYGNNLADLKRVNSSMHKFARAYFERLANHQYELDYIPSTNEVQQMLNPFASNQKPNDFVFGPNGSAVPVNQPFSSNGNQEFTIDDYEESKPLTDEEILINIENGVMQYLENPNEFGEGASVAYENSPQQTAFEQDSKGRTVWVNTGASNVGSNIIGLGAENFVDSEPVNPPGGFWSMLGRTQSGQDQMFGKRNDYLINMIIKKMKNPNTVNRLSIEEHSITINGLLVNTDAVIDDARGIRLIDIIDVRKMLNTFKNVTSVTLDSPMFQQLIIQMGDADDDVKNVWNIFKSNPNLQTLNIQLTPGAAFERITRRDFRQNAGKVSQMASNARFRKNTDFMASVHNPRLNESGMGERNTAFKIAGNLGNSAKQRLLSEHPNIWTGAGYGALALVAGGVGVVLGAGKGIVGLFRRRY